MNVHIVINSEEPEMIFFLALIRKESYNVSAWDYMRRHEAGRPKEKAESLMQYALTRSARTCENSFPGIDFASVNMIK